MNKWWVFYLALVLCTSSTVSADSTIPGRREIRGTIIGFKTFRCNSWADDPPQPGRLRCLCYVGIMENGRPTMVKAHVYGEPGDDRVTLFSWHRAELGDSIACQMDLKTRFVSNLNFIGRNGKDKRFVK